jgi:hypothetical protein
VDVLLSIITVSLNAAATIERTLASVALQQVNFGVEHICVPAQRVRGHLGVRRRHGQIGETAHFSTPSRHGVEDQSSDEAKGG